jgi:hypothetical protein
MGNVLWHEGFEIASHADALGKIYQEVAVGAVTDPRINGDRSMTIDTLLSPSLGVEQNLYMGFGTYGNPGTGSRRVNWFDGTDKQVYLEIAREDPGDDFWTIKVYNGDDVLLGTAATTLAANTWYFIEWHVYFHDTAGTVSVRINESVDSNFPVGSKDTAPSGNNQADQFKFGANFNLRVDDLYVTDDGFLGDMNITGYFPNGVGDTQDFDTTGSPHHEQVDDPATVYNENDYVESDNNTDVEMFHFQNLSGVTGAIEAISITPFAGLDAAGQRKFKTKHEGVGPAEQDLTGNKQTVNGTAVVGFREIVNKNPDTTNDWLLAELDASQFGIELTD